VPEIKPANADTIARNLAKDSTPILFNFATFSHFPKHTMIPIIPIAKTRVNHGDESMGVTTFGTQDSTLPANANK